MDGRTQLSNEDIRVIIFRYGAHRTKALADIEPLLVDFVTSGEVRPSPTPEICAGIGTNPILDGETGFRRTRSRRRSTRERKSSGQDQWPYLASLSGTSLPCHRRPARSASESQDYLRLRNISGYIACCDVIRITSRVPEHYFWHTTRFEPF